MIPGLVAADFPPGTVWLVGAGPGDPGLLTLHALHALTQADVVLHDALVSPDILALAPQARLEPAGKRAGGVQTPQLRINERLIRLAREGHRVVRLKGGDPLVFGRGGEEALALAAAGVAFRIVPGISAGIGGTASAGIPTTHRGLAHSVAFVTGHDSSGTLPRDLDWDALARGADVLVLYMAPAPHRRRSQTRLCAAGRSASEPIAFITDATTPRQCVRIATLADAARTAADDSNGRGDAGRRRSCRRAACAARRLAAGRADVHRAAAAARISLRGKQMPGLPMLPDTAPFPAEQITALNRIMSATNAEQRTWLSGFLAGYQAANAPQPAAAAPPARRAPLTILFATESGNAEALADIARKAAGKLGFAARVLDMADATPAQVAGAQNLLVIASTWGEGDPPQRAIDFHSALMADDAPRFEGLRYAVLALGDRAYAKFCETGRLFDERLAALGATRVADRIDCDLDYEAPANAWIGATLTHLQTELGEPEADSAVIHVDFARPPAEVSAYSRTRPFEAEITERIKLSGSRSTSETWHVELSLAGSGLTYEPGDSLGFLPVNDPALVDAVLAASGLSGDAQLHARLSEQFDITTLTTPELRRVCRHDRRCRADAAGRLAGDRPAGGCAASAGAGAVAVAAAAAAAALLLGRLEPQGGAGRGASAGRGGALCDAWPSAQRRRLGGYRRPAQGGRAAEAVRASRTSIFACRRIRSGRSS